MTQELDWDRAVSIVRYLARRVFAELTPNDQALAQEAQTHLNIQSSAEISPVLIRGIYANCSPKLKDWLNTKDETSIAWALRTAYADI